MKAANDFTIKRICPSAKICRSHGWNLQPQKGWQIEDELKTGRGRPAHKLWAITFLGRVRALLEIFGHGRGRANGRPSEL